MKNKRKGGLPILPAVVVLVIFCAGILLIEAQTKIIRRWIDNVVYDNHNHYLTCEQLPSLSEVEKILEEHHDIVDQIEAVNPGSVGIEVNRCDNGNADITFWYASHQDRLMIEQIIGNDTFFGVPYNLHNR